VKNIYRKLTQKIFLVPKEESIQKNIKTFSPSEKILFFALVILFIGSVIIILFNINKFFLVEVPSKGGMVTEGVIGSPRFINPILAVSDTDRDLTTLVYSGLMKATPDGNLVEDLAESYNISEDGLIYDFILKDDIFFHNGVKVNSDDVIFTIQKTQDVGLKSPKRASWDGVAVEKINDKEIRFILKQPYTPFLENTTIGILPSHIWADENSGQFSFSMFNNKPIGSGPYKIKKIKYNSSGKPLSYELKSFKKYALGEPYISNIKFIFYPSESSLIDGYKKREIENINSISPDKLSELEKIGAQIKHTPIPRVFAVFFNQNQATVLANKEVRESLAVALDKKKIIQKVLGGYGKEINGPIPYGILESAKNDKHNEIINAEERMELAQEILKKGGWKFDEEKTLWKKETKKENFELRFSLSTANTPELKSAAEIIAEEWRNIGADVNIKIFESGDLNQNIIRPRKYDMLLFGEVISRELDLFAFWHSSQRNDPGLNIASYANITADKLLEDARATTDKNVMIDKYKKFEDEISADIPAIFIYSPDFIYITSKNIKNFELGLVTAPEERFLNIHKWYKETDSVWNFFTD